MLTLNWAFVHLQNLNESCVSKKAELSFTTDNKTWSTNYVYVLHNVCSIRTILTSIHPPNFKTRTTVNTITIYSILTSNSFHLISVDYYCRQIWHQKRERNNTVFLNIAIIDD